jgi:hypothetical protein
MKLRSIPSLHVHGSRLAKISNSQRVRFIHNVCLVHITTANLDLSKQQYEGNFQKDNPAEREAAASKAHTEKVIVLKLSKNEMR